MRLNLRQNSLVEINVVKVPGGAVRVNPVRVVLEPHLPNPDKSKEVSETSTTKPSPDTPESL